MSKAKKPEKESAAKAALNLQLQRLDSDFSEGALCCSCLSRWKGESESGQHFQESAMADT